MRISGYLNACIDSFQNLFGLKDDLKRGRTCMVGSSIISSIVSSMTNGIFYTGFLLCYNIDLTGVGIITFIPYLASLVSLAAPLLIERFPRRRPLLALLRTLQWTVNLLGMTLLPLLVQDPGHRVIGFCVISFCGTALGSLSSSGFIPWHLNFIPNEVRASYFMVSSFITNTISGLFLILSGVIADSLSGSPHQMTIIITLRYVAFALALLEVWLLTRPKEFPYPPAKEKPHPSQVFSLPFHNRRFLKTEIIYVLYTVFLNLTSSVLNAYLLDSIGISYTLINIINTLYSFFLLLFSPFWRRQIARKGWLRTFSVTLLFISPTYILYMFISPDNFFWIFVIMRLIQHFIQVGQGTCVSNLLYLNMPEESKSSFVSFNTIVTSLASLLAMMLGTAFVSLMGEQALSFGSVSLSSIPLLMGVTAAGFLVLSFYVFHKAPELEPKE